MRLGLGVGIVAHMAIDEHDPDLVAIDAAHLFAAHTTWIGFRRGTLLRKYMYEFAQLLAPHLDRRLVERAHRAASAEEVARCLPIRCCRSAERPLHQLRRERRSAAGAVRPAAHRAGRRRRSARARRSAACEVLAGGELQGVEAAARQQKHLVLAHARAHRAQLAAEPKRSRSSRACE